MEQKIDRDRKMYQRKERERQSIRNTWRTREEGRLASNRESGKAGKKISI